MTHANLPGGSILVDEAGIESGVWGKFRLKSSYQPLFRQQGDRLVPFAVEGRISAWLDGKAVSPGRFNTQVTRESRPLLERLSRRLHVGNLENVAGSTWLGLFLGLGADAFVDLPALADDIKALSERMDEAGVEPERATLVFRDFADVEQEALVSLAVTIRAHGMRVCLEENGPVFSAPSLLWAIAPDMLCIGADRLRGLALEPQALRMVRSMYGVLRERGIEIAAAGVENRDDFACASDAGSGCFQGNYLARPGLAGTLLDVRPLQIDALRSMRDNVVPLFGLSA
jgi:EAL domain-containing protein (putative c-di-GMP-specific phosphodiesterase class I)